MKYLFGMVFLTIIFGCSSGKKNEWSAVQAIEYKNRNLSDIGVSVYQVDQYKVARIFKENYETPIYLLLNPETEPIIKQIPEDVSIKLDSSDYAKLAAVPEIDIRVLKELEKNAINGPSS